MSAVSWMLLIVGIWIALWPWVWDAVTGSRILYRKRARRRGWVER